VRGRLESGRGQRPELLAAVRQAHLSLDRLAPKPAKQDRRSGFGKSLPPLQEGQRKAVRAALAAGVAPAQVAKHFGLSLAAVRKVLDEPA
jgi:DNA-directed RNA polymerase specialized sigma24 family protein